MAVSQDRSQTAKIASSKNRKRSRGGMSFDKFTGERRNRCRNLPQSPSSPFSISKFASTTLVNAFTTDSTASFVKGCSVCR
ncbi:unnamed protein product [Phytomonas sp. Hart1]|nr:unnamed protein product [Phytomonas sp. Hart1]|eukprot:CCW69101.1 unnamed protein product [Phytomonas sp. isolate Hart1]